MTTTKPIEPRRKPLTELEKANGQIVSLELEVASLKRKLALECRRSELRAVAEHEKWLLALSMEVDTIRDRIIGRLPT